MFYRHMIADMCLVRELTFRALTRSDAVMRNLFDVLFHLVCVLSMALLIHCCALWDDLTAQSIDLRHPRGQHDKLQALCNRIISKHEEKLVDILVRFGKDEAATRHQFQEAFCGEEGAGICKS